MSENLCRSFKTDFMCHLIPHMPNETFVWRSWSSFVSLGIFALVSKVIVYTKLPPRKLQVAIDLLEMRSDVSLEAGCNSISVLQSIIPSTRPFGCLWLSKASSWAWL